MHGFGNGVAVNNFSCPLLCVFLDVFIRTNWISRDLHLACEDALNICACVYSAVSCAALFCASYTCSVGDGPGKGRIVFS